MADLTLANENPWYVLMTLYGEQEGDEVDWDLHERNRNVWNSWSCQNSSKEDRLTMFVDIELQDYDVSNWTDIKDKTLALHGAEMKRRNGSSLFIQVVQTVAILQICLT